MRAGVRQGGGGIQPCDVKLQSQRRFLMSQAWWGMPLMPVNRDTEAGGLRQSQQLRETLSNIGDLVSKILQSVKSNGGVVQW